MDKSPSIPDIPDIADFQSRGGIRGAAQVMYKYLKDLRVRLQVLFQQVSSDVTFLYGEADYTGGAPGNGTQSLIMISVPNSIPGYYSEVSYDKDLLGLQMTWYAGTNIVTILLQNNTGGSVALANGRFRVWVWPKILST